MIFVCLTASFGSHDYKVTIPAYRSVILLNINRSRSKTDKRQEEEVEEEKKKKKQAAL